MPAPHDLDPPSMTEGERQEKRRYDASFAFRMLHPMISRSQFGGQNPSSPLRAFEIEWDDRGIDEGDAGDVGDTGGEY